MSGFDEALDRHFDGGSVLIGIGGCEVGISDGVNAHNSKTGGTDTAAPKAEGFGGNIGGGDDIIETKDGVVDQP